MKINVPQLETKIKLTKDFTYKTSIYDDVYRKLNGLSLTSWDDVDDDEEEVTAILPTGTILLVKKLELNPHRNYDYMDFRVVNCPDSRLVKKPRPSPLIRVSTEVANEIEYEAFDE